MTACTSATERTTEAMPPAARIFRIVASCSFVTLPLSVLTSKAKNRPPMQAMMSGMPAVPYMPPCSFQQKHPGTLFRCFKTAFTMYDSFICQTNLPVFKASDTFDSKNPIVL